MALSPGRASFLIRSSCLLIRLSCLGFLIVLTALSACSSTQDTPDHPRRNASVKAFILEDNLTAGQSLEYNMTIANLGDEKDFDVAVEHRIFSTPASRVIKTQGEIVKMDQQWIYKDKKIEIPPDAPAGDYQLTVSISYGENLTAETGAFFTVARPVEEANKPGIAANKSGNAAPSNVSANASPPAEVSPPNSSAPPPSGKEVIVIHANRTFIPDKLAIEPGTTVVWIQKDKTSGEVAGSGFSSGPLGPGKEFRHTFNKIGIFDFYSQLTKAYGTITVDDPDNPTVRKRDPMSFRGGLND